MQHELHSLQFSKSLRMSSVGLPKPRLGKHYQPPCITTAADTSTTTASSSAASTSTASTSPSTTSTSAASTSNDPPLRDPWI
eukprot:3761694-Prymnesium_polylepis.1